MKSLWVPVQLLTILLGCSCGTYVYEATNQHRAVTAEEPAAKPSSITATELVIVDERGKKRISLGVKDGNSVFVIHNSREEPVLTASVSDKKALFELSGKADQKGGEISLSVSDESVAIQALSVANQSAALTTLDAGGVSFDLIQRFQAGKEDLRQFAASLSARPVGGALFITGPHHPKNATESTRIIASTDRQDNAELQVQDAKGKKLWSVP
ncbi:MAG: hypothetical protein IT461_01785 [Planctomycetes bacterium]|nr:hypothetical protein [Planctomycetota bacterium]